jgi:hypothetical protein
MVVFTRESGPGICATDLGSILTRRERVIRGSGWMIRSRGMGRRSGPTRLSLLVSFIREKSSAAANTPGRMGPISMGLGWTTCNKDWDIFRGKTGAPIPARCIRACSTDMVSIIMLMAINTEDSSKTTKIMDSVSLTGKAAKNIQATGKTAK